MDNRNQEHEEARAIRSFQTFPREIIYPLYLICVIFPVFLFSIFSTKELSFKPHIIAVFSGIEALLIVLTLMVRIRSKDDITLSQIIFERKEINDKIDQKPEPDILDTIRLSLNQLNEYYTINKNQAKSSFAFSVLAIVLGLGILLSGIWLYYYGEYSNISTTALTSISGILLEFIGGAYFFMYKKSLEQVNFFFGQLIKVQDTMLAINLSKGMESKPKAGEMTERIITSLLERSLK